MTSAIIEIFSTSAFGRAQKFLLTMLAGLAIASAISCSSSKSGYETLLNQGILPISPSNAYLGSNLYLGEEAGKSQLLYQFLKGRGTPGALKINQKSFKQPSIALYYPRQSQVYHAELETNGINYDWIIRGPYAIDRVDFRKLLDVERSKYESAPLIVNGQIIRFVEEIKPPTPVPTLIPTVKPKTIKKAESHKLPTPVQKPVKEAEPIEKIPTARPIGAIPSGPGLNSDQQAIRVSKGLVELSPEGDLVHKVQKDSESLEDLASWYTGDPAQAKTIAEFNGLASGSALTKGSKIKIPKAVSKTEQLKP